MDADLIALMDFSDDEFLHFEREVCAHSLADFAQAAWHVLEPTTPLKWGWALDAICQHLEAVTDGRITRLLMNVPPGTMKSLLTGVIWPAWKWGPRGMPEMRFIGTAHEEQLAIRDSRKCRDLIKSDWYQRRWPIELDKALDGKREFGNTRKGIRQARSFTSMTGVRGDCLLAGTLVQTEDGIQAIENIVACAYSGDVLSYDHDSNKLVYRPIKAVARRSSCDFYRVHFTDGGVVECTGDHKIYTNRGYIEARFLSKGDCCMRVLPEASGTDGFGHEKTRQKRIQTCDLLKAMQPNYDQHISRKDGSKLHNMQRENSQEQAPVFAGMQIRGIEAKGAEQQERDGVVFVPGVQDGESKAQFDDQSKVLFCCMQGRSSCCDNAWVKQPSLAQWSKRKTVRQGNKAGLQVSSRYCIQDGWRKVCGVPINAPSALPSYKSRLNRQQAREPCYVVSNVPYEASWSGTERTKTISVSLVERVRKTADVFDIQVGGTHCFFANGILVHNCIILDDPISAHSANSQAAIEAARIAFTETLPTRVNSEKSAIVVIMQRLHEKDTSGVIIDMGLPYTHLCIPMRFEPDRRCTTSIGWTDPRTVAGELMFPERFGEQQVRELEATLGSYGAAGQLQQRPTPRGGGLFKGAWWRFYGACPELTYRAIFADTAQKTAEGNDYSVFQCWGRSVTGGILLLDQIRGKWEAPELLAQARAFWEKHRTQHLYAPLRGMWVEDKSSGTGLIQTLGREGVPIIPVQRNRDKISRAHDVTPTMEAGLVYLPESSPWLSDYLAEFASFPMGAHDDQIDPTIDAITHMVRQSVTTYATGRGSQW